MADEQVQAEESKATKEWSSGIKELGDKIVALTLMQAQELADYLKEEYKSFTGWNEM